MRVLLLLLAALSACALAPPGTADQAALSAVEQAWDAASDLPDAAQCLDRVDVVRHSDRLSYVDACEGMQPGLPGGRDAAERSAGCLTHALRGMLGKRTTVIQIAPGYESDMGLVQHEALHELVGCALDRPASDPWDSGHADPRVWTAAGGATSVQSRARPPN